MGRFPSCSISEKFVVKVVYLLKTFRNFDFQSNLFSLGNKRKISFSLYFTRLFVTLQTVVDSKNEHIDQVMEDAPTKLKVTVTVCDTDWQKIQELHNQWMEQEKQMLADQYKQQETLWQKQSHRLTEIVSNNEGVWISTKLFYIVGSLSLLSIITIAMEIAFYVYFHWLQ